MGAEKPMPSVPHTLMIRHIRARRKDTVSDAVGCSRTFGSVFILSGTFALAVALFGLAGMGAENIGSRAIVALIGASHLLGGLTIGFGRWSRTEVTRAGVEHIVSRPLRRPQTRTFSPSEISRVEILTEQDSDGDDHFAIALTLASGESLRLTRQATPLRETAVGIADAVCDRLGMARMVAPPTCETLPPAKPLAISRRRLAEVGLD